MSVEQTAEEMMESLTGHDEMAIAQHFGRNVGDLMSKDSLMLARAMVFVAKRRTDLNDDDARNAALDMSFKEVMAFFADPAEESEESGKDEPEPEQRPVISLTSAS